MSGNRTDLYEIRMALSYLRRDMCAPATFSMFVRALPRSRGFLVAAGLADCLSFLEDFGFTDAELAALERITGLDVTPLAGLRFTGEVRAVEEGRVVFAGEPLLEVTAPLAEAQLVETALLNLVTYQTAIAAKAARCRIAAAGRDVVDFAARRTHGPDAAMAAARASRIAGFAGTSYVAAADRYGLAASGTMAHSYVQAFPDEHAAFEAFAADFPASAVFLVDTYDTLTGVDRAIDVARRMPANQPVGVRLDSGDLHTLSWVTRKRLDDAGLTGSRIIASGGLDEHSIARLVAAGAPIDVFGVGTRMGVSSDAPALDSVYKLVDLDGRPTMKLSAGKVGIPGRKQVFRAAGRPADVLAAHDEEVPRDHEPLLTTVVRDGRRVGPLRTETELVQDARDRFTADLAWLPAHARDLVDPTPVRVRVSDRLHALTEHVRRSLASQPS
ncbi:nicotinate phosphoribosyltransferase [Lentzea terrae]|uniref:nicotinate phosphoribosyltransferase n=1 Tax=Lentzea terrae TaxID=2200761 RepID=UPI000DD3D36F|nr:nicotinate phosphoribosyltransferase [Lentzea terrae]